MSEKQPITKGARRAVWMLVVACAVLALLDFVVYRKAYSAVEGLPLFYAVYGFVAFLIVVGGGVLLRRWVMRAPDYYEDKDE